VCRARRTHLVRAVGDRGPRHARRGAVLPALYAENPHARAPQARVAQLKGLEPAWSPRRRRSPLEAPCRPACWADAPPSKEQAMRLGVPHTAAMRQPAARAGFNQPRRRLGQRGLHRANLGCREPMRGTRTCSVRALPRVSAIEYATTEAPAVSVTPCYHSGNAFVCGARSARHVALRPARGRT
jgi:hypothetical protein